MAAFYTGPKRNNIWNNEMNFRELLGQEAKQQYKNMTTAVPDYKYRVPNGCTPIAPGYYVDPQNATPTPTARK